MSPTRSIARTFVDYFVLIKKTNNLWYGACASADLTSVPRFNQQYVQTNLSALLSHAEIMLNACLHASSLSSARHRSGHLLTRNLQPQPGRPANKFQGTHTHSLFTSPPTVVKPCRAGSSTACRLAPVALLP